MQEEMLHKYVHFKKLADKELEVLQALEDELNIELQKITINEDIDEIKFKEIVPKLKESHHNFNIYQLNMKKIEEDILTIYEITKNEIPVLLVLYKLDSPKSMKPTDSLEK